MKFTLNRLDVYASRLERSSIIAELRRRKAIDDAIRSAEREHPGVRFCSRCGSLERVPQEGENDFVGPLLPS